MGPKRKAGKGYFQLKAKNLFLTYPNCGLDPSAVLDILKARFAPCRVQYIVVGQEEHKCTQDPLTCPVVKEWGVMHKCSSSDTGLHLHALVQVKDFFRTRDASFADIAGHHGNYQAATYVRAVEKYVKKDGNFVVEGVPEYGSEKKSSDRIGVRVLSLIRQGTSVPSLMVHEDAVLASYVMSNLQKLKMAQKELEAYQASVENKKMLQVNEEAYAKMMCLRQMPIQLSECWMHLAQVTNWVYKNLVEKEPRRIKSPQLYVVAPPDFGKTSMIGVLTQCFKTFQTTIGNHAFDGYTDDVELVVFDEFHVKNFPNVRILNQFLDGSFMSVPCRYFNVVKAKPVPCIVLSNYKPSAMFVDEVAKAAFLARFEVVVFEADMIDAYPLKLWELFTSE